MHTVGTPLRVLLIEDSDSDAELVTRELRKISPALSIERVETAEAMRAALDQKTWDIVISDWALPTFNAPTALVVLQEAKLDIPFIIVSGTIGEDTAVDAMRSGARDYVLKDKLVRLAPAVERELRECKERAGRREAEAALRESEMRFKRLAESGIIGITIIDTDGNILDANDTYIEMLGYSRDEILKPGVRWLDFIPNDLKAFAQQAHDELREKGVVRAREMEVERKDGKRVPILAGAALLELPNSIAFTVDLTERRRAEDETARLAVRVDSEQGARVRAEEALRQSEEQLRQAQKMEAVGRLAGGVAHDFNNILSVILSYGELIQADLKPNDPLRDDIDEICKAAVRAAALTKQLLLFSRQQVLEPKVIDLNDALKGMHKMLQRIVGEDVELVAKTTNSVGRISADPSHIEQVILNLVVNARDAMPRGGKLTIETANVTLDSDYVQSHVPSKAGAYVMVTVTDNGEGMDRATQARIFEPFFTTKEQGKGTGLGLSTVFGIVQQSGGSIWVSSELGKGTTFKVYLPRVSSELDRLRPLATPSTLRGAETILVVEDEEQVRAIVLSILRRQGYVVISAQSGGDALLLCETHAGKIDLLLTDVVMPRMSGPELAKRLARTRPTMKVLCMSGYTDESNIRHGVVETGVAFIQKPITPMSLSMKVREVLDQDVLIA